MPGFLDIFRPTRKVWMTFDDGPHPRNTDMVLKALAGRQIKATFFVSGNQVTAHRDVLGRVIAAGHRIGNHGHSHRRLTELTEAEVEAEITQCEGALDGALGSDKLFRPPHGARSRIVDRVVRRLGYRTVLWDVDTMDWNHKFWPDKWTSHGADQIAKRRRSVVLAHDIQATTAEHFATFLDKVASGDVAFQDPATL